MKLDEIATLAGVSRTTASYVINGKAEQHRISKQTQSKVMQVVEEFNYRPNFAATALRAGSSHSMGLIIPDLENSSFAKLAKRLEAKLRAHNYQLVICCSDDNPNTEQQIATWLYERGMDLLFVVSCLPEPNAFYEDLQEKIPVIALDRPLEPNIFTSVISDDFDGAYRLTKTLIEKSIGSIALLGAHCELAISKRREEGFNQAISEYPFSLETKYVYLNQFDHLEAAQQMTKWLIDDALPDALLTTSFTLMEGVLEAMRAHPQKLNRVLLATFGNHRLLDLLPVPVISLAQPLDTIAELASELALAKLDGPLPAGQRIMRRILHRRE